MRNTEDDNHLPVFESREGTYAWSRLAGYMDISGPRATVKAENDGVVGVYVKAHKGEYTKDPAARILREEYFSHDVSIKVRFK